jgi:hypothetical protein
MTEKEKKEKREKKRQKENFRKTNIPVCPHCYTQKETHTWISSR